jgi:two-component system, chemotaxis family, sensor kinase CheA
VKDLRQRLLATFQIEHKEHVQRIRESLAGFESAGAWSAGTDLDDVFRRAHSLKGAARAVDLRPLENLAHRLETLFARVREGAMDLDAAAIKVVYRALDASEDWLAASGGASEPAPPTDALQAIEEMLGAQAVSPPTPASALTAAATPTPATPPATLAPVDMLRLNAASLDRIVSSSGQLLTESLRQAHVTRSLRQVNEQLAETASERDRVRRSGARVFQKLDSSPDLAAVARYVNYLDHQIHTLTKQVGAAVQLQERNAWTLRSLAGELQRDVRQARMVPAENVFEGFRKMVRDLARDAGKAVDLHVSGWQVEADRIVLQALRDPVMHMLRNAISHGLETEAERKSARKPAEGRIELTIEARGNQLSVSVEDDGRGIDAAKVAEVAIRKGLIAETAAATLPSADVMRLILLPGFSTSRSVDDLSGRGMGLSVVAQAVARLQGKVDIGPGQHAGTRVSIAAPLSVSSHRLLLVTCQGQSLAIPLHGIERLWRVKLADVQTVESKPVIKVDGRTVPVVSLASLLHASATNVSANENVLCVLIMRAGAERLAVAVDSFLSERDAIIKDLPAPADQNPQVAGGILLEDGSVCLVLNPAEIVKGFDQSANTLVLAPEVAAARDEKQPFEILVVDDSLTTRTLEKSVLEAHGYRVAIAVDGVDALNYLRAGRVGLVISDVEMPRLDGFGLLKEMKGDPRLANIPVIIVSSIESPEDQARGLTLGADAYVVKRKFDQQELLETIRQIV